MTVKFTVSCAPPFPAEPVTVTVEFPAGVTGPVGVEEPPVLPDPPPHPEIKPMQARIRPMARTSTEQKRLAAKIRLRKPKHSTRLVSPAAAQIIFEPAEGIRWKPSPSNDVVVTFVVIVSVVVRAVLDPAGDRVAGLKAHVEYCGRPEQLKFTVPLNPPAGVKVMVEVPDWPATIVKDVGLAASEKLGATDALTVTLRLALAVSGVLSESFTSTVKLALAAVVGVPETTPVLVASDSPAGRVPELTLQV